MRVGQFFEAGDIRFEDFVDGVFGGELPSLDAISRLSAECRVGDDRGVGHQDVGILGTEPGPGLGLGLIGLDPGGLQRSVEPIKLEGRVERGAGKGGELETFLVEDDDGADRNAGTDRDPLQDFHRGVGREGAGARLDILPQGLDRF